MMNQLVLIPLNLNIIIFRLNCPFAVSAALSPLGINFMPICGFYPAFSVFGSILKTTFKYLATIW